MTPLPCPPRQLLGFTRYYTLILEHAKSNIAGGKSLVFVLVRAHVRACVRACVRAYARANVCPGSFT